jgi:predicted DNA-binding WGR domain protein
VNLIRTAKPRSFECVEGGSRKFWEISRAGKIMTTRWGRIGSAGQSTAKTFANKHAAAKAMMKLIAKKTRGGYQEVAPAK